MLDDEINLIAGRGHLRGETSFNRPPGGHPPRPSRRTVPCPRCGAGPGEPCQRWVGGKIAGVDVGGGYWRTMTSYHDGRRTYHKKGADQ